MSSDSYNMILIGGYEQMFIKLVLNTYPMLKDLDTVKNDEEFYELFSRIEDAYIDIESVKEKYYDLLTRDGGNAKHCSLHHEMEQGFDFLWEKYNAIKDIIQAI